MPILTSDYRAPPWLKGGHVQTIVPALFRNVTGVILQRERIHTSDGDFLDIDWSRKGSNKIAIVSHGLEGCSRQPYMLGMIKSLNEAGWDAVSWNFRGCSGELNNKVRFYHAGSSEDLATVIAHIRQTGQYEQIALIGFSLGGSMSLKYLGENSGKLFPEISHAIVFSVPGDLSACVQEISSTPFHNNVYHQRFMKSIRAKLAEKLVQYPDLLGHINLKQLHSIEDFDNVFTAPLCGFENAQDYYKKCSCNQFIEAIRIPTLIANAHNDPLLHRDSHPHRECKDHKHVILQMTNHGGHVGFVHTDLHHNHWSDQRAVEFLKAA